MGVQMSQNNGRLLALFDELSSFLTKLKLCGSKGLSDSHEFYGFLELYNANEWTRSTGKLQHFYTSTHVHAPKRRIPNILKKSI